jgi:glycosyltransferase involved in cell wall biosynthesis
MVHTGLPPIRSNHQRELARRDLGIPLSATVAVWVGRHQEAKQPQLLAPLVRKLEGTATVVALGRDLTGSPEGEAFAAGGGVMAPENMSSSAVYAAGDLCVQTSAWESFPLVPLEAMQRGLPVVSFAVGGIPEQIDDGRTGFLVAPDDLDGLAARAGQLACDADRRRAMGRAAAAEMKTRFSSERWCEQIATVYRATLDRPD